MLISQRCSLFSKSDVLEKLVQGQFCPALIFFFFFYCALILLMHTSYVFTRKAAARMPFPHIDNRVTDKFQSLFQYWVMFMLQFLSNLCSSMLST